MIINIVSGFISYNILEILYILSTSDDHKSHSSSDIMCDCMNTTTSLCNIYYRKTDFGRNILNLKKTLFNINLFRIEIITKVVFMNHILHNNGSKHDLFFHVV